MYHEVLSHELMTYCSSSSVPVGAVLIAVTFWAFPKNVVPLKITRKTLSLIDWPGTVLFLVAICTLNFALQEGGSQYAWDSGAIISTLVIQTISWGALVYWETRLTSKGTKTTMLPIWPSRLFTSRVIGCAML